jgi:hypothetical protein
MEDYSKFRVAPRYACSGTAEILHNGSLCWGRVCDISNQGCCVETLYPLPNGSEVQLRLTVAGTVLDIGATVAWIVPQSVMAMSFGIGSEEQENKLAEIIEKVKAASNPAPVDSALQPETENVQVLRDAKLLSMIKKRINEKGILTKKELIEMVNANR